jgi:NAD(P)-dependent dehydrogenase (short-subunit alcohol dehydrogenase family)
VATKSGYIILTAMVDALIGCAGLDAYTAAKGGVVAVTRSFPARIAKHGGRVNAMCPSFVLTEPQWIGSSGRKLCIFWWGLSGFLSKIGSASASPEQMQILFTEGMLSLAAVALWRGKHRAGPPGDRIGRQNIHPGVMLSYEKEAS